MLTPQEVSERAFPKASFGGYNMTQVDEFLDVLTEDYSALYSENAVLKSKMKVLVEKVEEYRSTEEAMRKALMTAQRMADDLVKEAEQKRDQILQEAAAEAQKKVDSIRQEAEAEQFRLAAAQKETAGYVAKVKALHAQAQAYLDQLDQLVPAAPDQQEEKMEEAVSDIDDSVQRLVAQAMAEAAAENEKVRHNSKQILFLTDLVGGTPFSTAVLLSEENPEYKVFGGCNMPMIISAIELSEEEDINYIADEILNFAKDNIILFNPIITNTSTDDEDGI